MIWVLSFLFHFQAQDFLKLIEESKDLWIKIKYSQTFMTFVILFVQLTKNTTLASGEWDMVLHHGKSPATLHCKSSLTLHSNNPSILYDNHVQLNSSWQQSHDTFHHSPSNFHGNSLLPLMATASFKSPWQHLFQSP